MASTPDRRRSPRIRTAALVALLGAIGVLVGVWVFSDADEGTVRAAFSGAPQVVPGNEVRLAGQQVGEVETVEYVDGQAVLELEITETSAWPLPRGTAAALRFGTTASSVARYVELDPGPASEPPLENGGLLTRRDTLTPVEFDDMNRILDRATRRDVRPLIADLSTAIDGHQRDLGTGIEATAGGLDQLASLMRELGADRAALGTLVSAGARTAHAVARRDVQLRALITNAAATFDEFADQSAETQAAFDRFPPTLRVTRDSLARLDESLVGLTGLVSDIAPGARRLRGLAPVASHAVATLRDVAPLATSTLNRARRASPRIEELLRQGTPLLGQLERVLSQASPQFECIRPFAPEFAGFLSTWSGYAQRYDGIDHFGRDLAPQAIPIPNGTSQSSAEIVESTPGVEYAFPRPPGLNAGQPWFIGTCNLGRETLDPRQDPETVSGN
jgi:phospholipid/cholesterol/gamma-HCH transport system substrate-binding protein